MSARREYFCRTMYNEVKGYSLEMWNYYEDSEHYNNVLI